MKIVIVYLLVSLVMLASTVGMHFYYTTNEGWYVFFLPLICLSTFPAFKYWVKYFSKYINL